MEPTATTATDEAAATADGDVEQSTAMPQGAEGAGISADNSHDPVGIAVNEDGLENERRGTTSSARFNILSTMVGGGCLSLPLAFQQSGNAFLGPLLLVVTALLSDFCFRLLVASAKQLSGVDHSRRGADSFESITSAAFGPSAFVFSKALVTAMCFFGAVGYCVLLRDMLQPINDSLPVFAEWTWLHTNLSMFAVVLVVTPLCTLQTFTALKSCNATSMFSILILGTSIVIRSLQCNFAAIEHPHGNDGNDKTTSGSSALFLSAVSENDPQNPWYSQLHAFPESARDVLNALPLYISCFVCHYNILPVHNELREPSPVRVSWWIRTTTWSAFTLYVILGFAGSMYANCTSTGQVQGNVLLDFDKHDPLLLVGRMCLAVTITLAFPMLVIPARDIVMRSMGMPDHGNVGETIDAPTASLEGQAAMEEPLLPENGLVDATENGDATGASGGVSSLSSASFSSRLVVATSIFWTAAAVASCVKSIDIVWDLLGSSLSILLSYLIPCGVYLRIVTEDQTGSRYLAWTIIAVFTPLMFVSTVNAVVNTFSG